MAENQNKPDSSHIGRTILISELVSTPILIGAFIFAGVPLLVLAAVAAMGVFMAGVGLVFINRGKKQAEQSKERW